jgi:hypothetical protein
MESKITQFLNKVEDLRSRKNTEYADDYDALHNFRCAAAMQNTTEYRALTGMLAKHIISIFDMADGTEDGNYPLESQWFEKLADACNYLFILWAMVSERQEKAMAVGDINK